jgi:transcriptional regulator with XRE-family HTH domain
MKRNRNIRHDPSNLTRFLRIAAGMSYRDLSDQTGIPITTIENIEHGRYGLYPTLKKLADRFGTTVDALAKSDYAALARTRKEPVKIFTAHKQAYRKRQLDRNETGDLGEQFVLELERKRLAGTPYANLVNANYSEDLQAGFDILSFTESGQPIHIEVKSTRLGNTDEPFYMSLNEKRFAEHCRDKGLDYRLYRVYGMAQKREKWKYEVYTAEELLGYDFSVDSFVVRKGV